MAFRRCRMVPFPLDAARGMHLYIFKLYHYFECDCKREYLLQSYIQRDLISNTFIGTTHSRFDCFHMPLVVMELL
jgi:hypothetical protein